MPRQVTISTISCSAYPSAEQMPYETMVTRVIEHLRGRIAQVLPDKPDLIVLPECCDRPAQYVSDRKQIPDYYRVRGDRVLNALQDMARAHRCHIAYSAMRILPDGAGRNSTQLIGRQGQVIGIYNKNHLVIEENTENNALYGKDAPVFDCDFGRVACAICFDLNFDELRLKYVRARADLIVFCSMYHGGLMQNYWAYSCRAHFVAALGHRATPGAILNPLGETLAQATNYFDFVTARVNLDCVVAHLDYNWEKLTALKAKYGTGVTIRDPGRLGPVLITSETEGISARAMAAEFGIELLDDYFVRALAHRHAPGHIES